MKKEYRKPVVEIEGFVPNEYVAVCSWVQLPGNGEWVEAIDIQATQYYENWKSTDLEHPRPDVGRTYPVFNGSFKVKDSNAEGGYKNYDTSISNYGDPHWTEPKCTIDYCCNSQIYNEYTGEGSWDGYHYHYNGITTNHS